MSKSILHINTTKEWRGGDMQMLTTYRLISKYNDVRQWIFCPSDSKMAAELSKIHVSFESAFERKKIELAYLRKIVNVIRQNKVSILHAHDSYGLGLSLLATFVFPKLKVVFSRKRNNPIKKNYLKKLKFDSSRLSKIVCVSKAVKKIFEDIVADPDKVLVIYDGVDVEAIKQRDGQNKLRSSLNVSKDCRLIANIAAFTPQKDLFTFIDAAADIKAKSEHDTLFVLLGGGPLEDALQDYAKEKGMADDIVFPGFRDDINEILCEFDLLLMSSETEGLPLTVYEAFAAHVPVVATDAGGIPEAVLHGETGMLSPVRDATRLAENALAVLSDQALKDKIITNASALVREKHSLAAMQQQYYRLYCSLA